MDEREQFFLIIQAMSTIIITMHDYDDADKLLEELINAIHMMRTKSTSKNFCP